jgi:hypothetical protein
MLLYVHATIERASMSGTTKPKPASGRESWAVR